MNRKTMLAVCLVSAICSASGASQLVQVGSNGAGEDPQILAYEKAFWSGYQEGIVDGRHVGSYAAISPLIEKMKKGLKRAQDLEASAKSAQARERARGYQALMRARLGWLHLWRASEMGLYAKAEKLKPGQAKALAGPDAATAAKMFVAAYGIISSLPDYEHPKPGTLMAGFKAWQPTLQMSTMGFQGAATYGTGRGLVKVGAALVAEGLAARGFELLTTGGQDLTEGKEMLEASVRKYEDFNGFTRAAVTQTDLGMLHQNLTSLLGILNGCVQTEKYGHEFAAYRAFAAKLPAALQVPATTIKASRTQICVNTNRVPGNFETQFMTLGDLLFMAQGQTFGGKPSPHGGMEGGTPYGISMAQVREAWNLARDGSDSNWVADQYVGLRLGLIDSRSGALTAPTYTLHQGTVPGTRSARTTTVLSLDSSAADRVTLLRSSKFQAQGCLSCHHAK